MFSSEVKTYDELRSPFLVIFTVLRSLSQSRSGSALRRKKTPSERNMIIVSTNCVKCIVRVDCKVSILDCNDVGFHAPLFWKVVFIYSFKSQSSETINVKQKQICLNSYIVATAKSEYEREFSLSFLRSRRLSSGTLQSRRSDQMRHIESASNTSQLCAAACCLY